MKVLRIFLIVLFVGAVFYACKEEWRFAISSKDTTIPSKPEVVNIKPLPGGARIFYKVPPQEQVLQIVAQLTSMDGKLHTFSSSYFKDSIDVYGMGEEKEYVFKMWAETRAGNKSAVETVRATPLKAGIWYVNESVGIQPGFDAVVLDWKNIVEQQVSVFVDLEFNMQGKKREVMLVYSSNYRTGRQFIKDLPRDEPIKIKVRTADIYGNTTDTREWADVRLLYDEKIPKAKWVLPMTNDSIDWQPMCFGDGANGRLERVIDDVIDSRDGMSNYMHGQERGRTGSTQLPNPLPYPGYSVRVPWNLFIDLGDYYRISRMITHQRHSMTDGNPRGHLYRGENVGHFRVWYLDETKPEGTPPPNKKPGRTWKIFGEEVRGTWILLSEHYIPIPDVKAPEEYPKLGAKGDETYMLPDDVDYTPPTRWFRYEAIRGFVTENGKPYANDNSNCLSEVTLFGIPAQKPNGNGNGE